MTNEERIKADAERFTKDEGYQKVYIAGATAEAKLSKRLLDAIEQIAHAPVPANEREYISWFVTAKNIAGGAISAYKAENEASQWKSGKGKEVEP